MSRTRTRSAGPARAAAAKIARKAPPKPKRSTPRDLPAAARALAGRLAVITGGAAGLGRAIAARLAADGARVVLADRDGAGARRAAAELAAEGAEAYGHAVDVSAPADVASLFAGVAELGAVDIVINNAGIMQPSDVIDEATFDRIVAVNLSGPRHCLRHALPVMLRAGRGVVVNVSSNLAVRPWHAQPLYSSTKAGLIGLTTSAARYAAGRGVRINAICPGAFATAMLSDTAGGHQAAERVFGHICPTGRVGRVEELAAAVAWLVSDEASYVNGATVVVDGGTVAW